MATRLYFSTQNPPVSPATISGWTITGNVVRASLALAKDNSNPVSNFVNLAAGGDQGLVWQLISPPMNAGIVFTSGSTTVSGLVLAANDGVAGSALMAHGYRIVSQDGTVVRSNIMGLDTYGGSGLNSVAFWSNGIPSFPVALGMGYTTVAGDRIVAEIGAYYNSAADTARVKISSLNADSDFTVTNQTAGNPWIEFSNTITFQASTGSAGTRGMMVNTGSLGVRA